MSIFCLFVIENIKACETSLYAAQIEKLAKFYNRGIKYGIDWNEPILAHINKDSLIVNISDSPETDNCEMFLLPDGWWHNGQSNELTFIERMKFLKDISDIFVNEKYPISFYFAQSGTDIVDFFDIFLNSHCLTNYLMQTIGVNGVENGLHIILTNNRI